MTRDSPDCKSPVNRRVIVRHDAAIVVPVDCPHLSRDFADILRGVRDKESRSCTDLWNRKSVWMTARSRALLHRLGCHSVKDEQDLANDVAFNLMKQLPKPGLAWVTSESTFEKIAMCQIKQLGSDIYRKYDLEQSRTVCQSDMSEGIFDALVDVHSIAGDLDECEHIAEALRVLPRKLEPIARSYLSGVAVIRIAAARGVHVGTIYRNLHAIFAIWIDWEQR